MKENHKKFLKHLDDSADTVFTCAKYFYNKGIPVEISPMTKAKNHGEWKSHADNGDLLISQRIEVKGLSHDFTCADDWKFGKEFIICAKHSWDLANPKPYAYMICNRERTHVAIVYGRTKDKWTTKTVQDSRYNEYTQECYLCPLEYIIWEKL